MANYWFRMYSEVLEDPKVQRLSAENFRHWVNILCIVSRQNTAELPSLYDLAFMLRLSEKAVVQVIDKLVAANLLDHTDRGLEPHNWRKRQYKSDVSTDRVRRYREKNGAAYETGMKRFRNGEGNGNETPPELELDTELDTETELKNKKRARARVVAKPSTVDSQVWEDFQTHRTKLRAPVTETALLGIEREAMLAGISLNDALKTCCERGWRGFKAEWIEQRLVDPKGRVSPITMKSMNNLKEYLRD